MLRFLANYLLLFATIHMCNCHVGTKENPLGTVTFASLSDHLEMANCTVSPCTGPLEPFYCKGKILALQWFLGPQKCTGNHIKQKPEEILKDFKLLPVVPSKEEFAAFCSKHFETKEILDTVTPKDWVKNPASFSKITDESYKEFALALNVKWKELARKMNSDILEHPEEYSMIPVNNTFIVPGGGFSIYFYWDSFWIIKGLLFSGMTDTVRGMLQNFANLIKTHGFIPNAGVKSEAGRSQPPLYCQMVSDLYAKTNDTADVRRYIDSLDMEMKWWEHHRVVKVTRARAGRSGQYTMFNYKTEMNCPRPETYPVDYENAINSTFPKQFVWSSIASAAESGWDFSTRWFAYEGKGAYTKDQIKTIVIVPVDLNTFMCKNYATMARFHTLLGNSDQARQYSTKKMDLAEAMEDVLWNEHSGNWFDYDIQKQYHRDKFYPSNYFPLWCGIDCVPNLNDKLSKIWDSVRACEAFDLYKFRGGIPTSLHQDSGQQWDYPNAWPPLNHMLIEGLQNTQHPDMVNYTLDLASRWVASNYRGWKACGQMWEKYDARYNDGQPGGSGEYKVQSGFGWTNGVVLDLLNKYGDQLRSPQGPDEPSVYVCHDISRRYDQERAQLLATPHLAAAEADWSAPVIIVVVFVIVFGFIGCFALYGSFSQQKSLLFWKQIRNDRTSDPLLIETVLNEYDSTDSENDAL